MQYLPFAAVPKINIRSPQTTLLHRGRKGEFNEKAPCGLVTRFYCCTYSWLKKKKNAQKQLKKLGESLEQNTTFNTLAKGGITGGLHGENKHGSTDSRSKTQEMKRSLVT